MHKSSLKKTTAKAPSSGNFLTSLVVDKEKVQQRQLDTLFCLLNGMHAASGASRALVVFLDDLLSVDDDEEAVVVVTSEHQKASALIELAREELVRYSDTYQKLLTDRIAESLVIWCGNTDTSGNPVRAKRGALCFRELQLFFERETYNLDGNSIGLAESDERLEQELIGPLRNAKFLQQLPDKCEAEVLRIAAERVAATVVDIVLDSLWKTSDAGTKKKFTDWGSLLLSKQSRMLQTYISTNILQPSAAQLGTGHVAPVNASNLLRIWERLSQVVTVLQLEKPSDWLAYHSTSILSANELSRTQHLRVDFSSDAIESVVSSVSPHAAEGSPTEER